MGPLTVGAIVSYQGRCWLVTRVAGAMLHLATPTTPGHVAMADVHRSQASTNLQATEGGRNVEMFCPLKRSVQSSTSK